MARFFSDMFNKKGELLGEVAEGDWSPVPPGQLAVPRLTPPPPPTPRQDSWVNVLRCLGEHLTDEELLIVREQLAS